MANAGSKAMAVKIKRRRLSDSFMHPRRGTLNQPYRRLTVSSTPQDGLLADRAAAYVPGDEDLATSSPTGAESGSPPTQEALEGSTRRTPQLTVRKPGGFHRCRHCPKTNL